MSTEKTLLNPAGPSYRCVPGNGRRAGVPGGGVLDGAPVFPDFSLAVNEIVGRDAGWKACATGVRRRGAAPA